MVDKLTALRRFSDTGSTFVRLDGTGVSYEVSVARGDIPGAELFSAYGEAAPTGAASGMLWPDGAYMLPPAAGVQPSLSSLSPDDNAAGTGIRTVAVHYLDSSLVRNAETVTLNGTTPVVMSATNVRFIESVVALTVGTGRCAADIITAYVGVQVYSQIPLGGLHSVSSVRMVPAGKRAMVTGIFAGASSGTSSAVVKVYIATTKYYGVDYSAGSLFFPLAAATYQDASNGLPFSPPIPFDEGTAFGLYYTTDKAAIIDGAWFGYLEDA